MSSAPSNERELQPLRGLRLLDLSRYAPGPFCSLLCSELGGEVIKIESPDGGDPLRALDEEAFRRLNRGKKSLTLNLKTEAGRRAFFALMPGTDVLIEGFRPGVLARMGIDPEELVGRWPRLVVVSITGYGQRGPRRERAGHDINYMAAAGALGDGDRPPAIQVADFAAGGLYATLAILAATLEVRGGGGGRHIDVSMLDGLKSFLSLASSAVGPLLAGRAPNYGIYRTRDGSRLALGALEPKFWQAFCGGLSRPDLAERISDPTAREEVARELSQRDRTFWEIRFRDLDACVEWVADPAEVVGSSGAGGDDETARLPFASGATRTSSTEKTSPRLGEHSHELLAETGLAPAAIAELIETGVSSVPPTENEKKR